MDIYQNFEFLKEEIRNYYTFDVMNININDLKDSLEFTKISWDTTNEFNILISDLINRDLDIMGEATSNDEKVMTFVTCKMVSNE